MGIVICGAPAGSALPAQPLLWQNRRPAFPASPRAGAPKHRLAAWWDVAAFFAGKAGANGRVNRNSTALAEHGHGAARLSRVRRHHGQSPRHPVAPAGSTRRENGGHERHASGVDAPGYLHGLKRCASGAESLAVCLQSTSATPLAKIANTHFSIAISADSIGASGLAGL